MPDFCGSPIRRPAPGGGSSVHVVWEQTSKNLTALVGVTVMWFIGRAS
jgi:hypothetical protein